MLKRVFDDAREMSSLDGSIVVNVDDLVGIQEIVNTTFYEWWQNGEHEKDKFERVAVQQLMFKMCPRHVIF